MKTPSKRTLLVMTAAVTVVIARAGLPALLTWLANTAVRKIPGIRGKVRRMELNFLAPGLTVNGLSVALLNGNAPGHRIEVGTVAIKSRWNALVSAHHNLTTLRSQTQRTSEWRISE
jgi:hypothetical protein